MWDTLEVAKEYFRRQQLPFPCLVDPDHKVYDSYGVENKVISLGQRPALFIIDKAGAVRYGQIGLQQWEITPDNEILWQLERIEAQLEEA